MRQVSKTNHIHTSTGETLTRAEFNRRVNEAKEKKIQDQLNRFDFNFCEDCSKEGRISKIRIGGIDFDFLDSSHEISVKECIELGRAELAYNIDYLTIRCRYHHRIFDKSNLKFKANEKRPTL